MKYQIINTEAGVTVAEYEDSAPRLPFDVDPAYVGTKYQTLDENGQAVDVAAIDPRQWRISVGALFDRFGAYKYAILADADPTIRSVVIDATVRKYIDLVGRRADLEQAVMLFNSKGYAVSSADVVDAVPQAHELWNN